MSNRRVVLLCRLKDGRLAHIELQSCNERHFGFRMGQYLFEIARRFGCLPVQIVLYVGEAPLRMKNRVEGPGVSVEFCMVDIRDLDGERLLASANIGDNVLAVLTRLGQEPKAVRRILERIVAGAAGDRETAFAELLILAGLRKLDEEVRREAKRMPILNDIMDHSVLGPVLRQGGQKDGLRDSWSCCLDKQRSDSADFPRTSASVLLPSSPRN